MIWINTLLSLLLLCLAIVLMVTEHKFKLIAYFAAFSVTAACLYFVNYAPDISLAEIAVGCAFIPLIFTIAITRQNTLVVLFFHKPDEQSYCDPDVMIEFMTIAEAFCSDNGLKLKILTKPIHYMPDINGIFKPGNIDLLADYQEETKVLKLHGNLKNVLIPKLKERLRGHKRLKFHETEVELYED